MFIKVGAGTEPSHQHDTLDMISTRTSQEAAVPYVDRKSSPHGALYLFINQIVNVPQDGPEDLLDMNSGQVSTLATMPFENDF